jgi:hypothetical protein
MKAMLRRCTRWKSKVPSSRLAHKAATELREHTLKTNEHNPQRASIRTSLVLCMVCLLGGLAVVLAQDFRITGTRIGADGRIVLRHPADTNSYYILYRGGLTNIALATDVKLGTNGLGELVGVNVNNNGASTFFRVRQVPLSAPLDTDGDGMDDVFELRHPAVLNPLDPADSAQDPDHDGQTNLQEYQAGTNPKFGPLVLSAPTTITCASTGAYYLRDLIISNTTVTIDCELVVNSLQVRSNGVLTHTAVRTNGLRLRVVGNAEVSVGSAISASGKGFVRGSSGPGDGCTGYLQSPSGGGHGGQGGAASCGGGGGVYGSVTEPLELGSHGGDDTGGGVGGAGGGIVRLIVGGTLLVDGGISADGITGSPSSAASGGAGGSIWLTVGALAGSGAISATGGYGPSGGGGGGGRIAIYTTCQSSFSQVSVLGGVGAGGGTHNGTNGTIYLAPVDLDGDGPLAAAYGDCVNLFDRAYILSQPQDLEVVAGATAQFDVQAISRLPMRYQWQHNGVDVAGGTNATLVLERVTPDMAGLYQVIITTAAGNMYSRLATLTVDVCTPAPAGLVVWWRGEGS